MTDIAYRTVDEFWKSSRDLHRCYGFPERFNLFCGTRSGNAKLEGIQNIIDMIVIHSFISGSGVGHRITEVRLGSERRWSE
jgi:hypothetical protein